MDVLFMAASLMGSITGYRCWIKSLELEQELLSSTTGGVITMILNVDAPLYDQMQEHLFPPSVSQVSVIR